MDQQTDRSAAPAPSTSSSGGMAAVDLNWPAIAMMIGGFLAAAGVFLRWFSYTNGELILRNFGTADFTGVAALILGVLTIACGAAVMMNDEGMQRAGRTVGVVAAVLTLLFVLYGLTRATDAISEAQVAALGGTFETGLAFGIWVSAMGAIIAVAGAAMSVKDRGFGS